MDKKLTGMVHRFIVKPKARNDPRSLGYLADAHSLGLNQVREIQCYDLYFLRGDLREDQVRQAADQLLHDPVTQQVEAALLKTAPGDRDGGEPGRLIEVALRPGVTDPIATQILHSTHLIHLNNINAASTGLRFVIKGDEITDELLHILATRLFANPIIQRYALGEITPTFLEPVEPNTTVETVVLRGKNAEELLQASNDHRAALNLIEMQAIQAYCEQEKRDLTDIEFEMLAQTWSEHCVHKTFKAKVHIEQSSEQDRKYPQEYNHLFNETIRAATREISANWVKSAFRDNAGIIAFDDDHELSFKVETHNHPSAIEPFGGANTGIGGVIRDVIGVSAKPIASTDVLCFGPQNTDLLDLPEGVQHPRRIASGVVAGIEDYGNKMGIPTVNGAIWYDPGYIANPLVFCGSVGLAPVGSHPRDVQTGDHILVLGGRTGRDGLRGATFSSMTMDAQTGEVSGASVQIGAPIVEKSLVDVLMIARDRKLYHAITDCGAGGLSSAVGEMVSETGGDIQLAEVPLKYPGLAPWEIWLSEAQERMVIAVPLENLAEIQKICDEYLVEVTDIGTINQSGRTRVWYGKWMILDLANRFLHEGLPQRQYRAVIQPPKYAAGWRNPESLSQNDGFGETLLRLLAHPNIASKEKVIRVYDHEVQGGTVVKPLSGVMRDGPSDGCVIKPLVGKGKQAFVLSAGINPEYGKLDPYEMTLLVMDEAIRNAAACGADPDRIAILDNFCWGDPTRSEIMGDLVQAAQACYDGAVGYRTPFISGKDSFNNEYLGSDGKRHAIPPTLLISAMGMLPDWELAITMDLKQPGDLVYLAGDFKPAFGGSHYNLTHPETLVEEGLPKCSPINPKFYRHLFTAIQNRLVLSCHDLSEGGLAVTAAEMALAGKLGLTLDLDEEDPGRTLFGETSGCLLVEVTSENKFLFEKEMRDMPYRLIGKVQETTSLQVVNRGSRVLNLPLNKILQAWKGENMGGQVR
jgi:phosphoribosylformylglycinamidine synthase subunit PurSL